MLDFRNSKFYWPIRLRGLQCVIVPNFMVICEALLHYGDLTLFTMAAVRHLNWILN